MLYVADHRAAICKSFHHLALLSRELHEPFWDKFAIVFKVAVATGLQHFAAAPELRAEAISRRDVAEMTFQVICEV